MIEDRREEFDRMRRESDNEEDDADKTYKVYMYSLLLSLNFHCKAVIQLMAQFRIFPSSESRHSFVANYTSAVKFKKHILVLFCCIIIPLYVSESKYL